MIRKISIDDLRPGMRVAALESTVWLHHPFLYSKPGLIEGQGDIDAIRAAGFLETFIDTEPAGATAPQAEEQALSRSMEQGPDQWFGPGMRVPVSEELPRAQKRYAAAIRASRNIVGRAMARRPLDAAEISDAVEDVIDSVLRSPGAMVCLSRLKRYDAYTFTHSANVCALAAMFGLFLGMERDRLADLATAGLLHDVGKVLVPAEILTRRRSLTPAEMEQMRRHPRNGEAILKRQSDFSPAVVRAVVEHHEQYNGQGYPDRLKADGISLFGRILALCDTFDALTSDRAYRHSLAPSKAVSLIYGMRGQDFAPREAELFIKCVGIYPAGCLVRLSSGEFGVVYESAPNHPLLPTVNVILDRRMRPLTPRTVDLSDGDAGLDIVECLNPLNYSIDFQSCLGTALPFN